MKSKKTKLGLWMLTTLVAGNMIGSGVFLLPSSLASFGSIGLVAWVFTAVGAMLLAGVFARMSILVPKTGGPYAFARAAYGEFVGLQTAFNYWVALWVGNAAIALAFVGYLRVFFPVLENQYYTCFAAIAAVWFFVFVNMLGVRKAGALQIITTVCKLIPILLISILGWKYFHPSYLMGANFNVTGHSSFSALSGAATLTLWAFIGLESATVPADSVDNPKRNIPIATMLGTGIAAVVYLASGTAIMGMIPIHELQNSTSPFADAAMIIFGPWGQWLIAVGAIVSCLGALNGWVLLQGQVAMAAADDRLFPKIFAKRNKMGVPVAGLVITTILISGLLLLTSSKSLLQQFNLVILTATLASLIPYFYTAIAEIVLRRNTTSTSFAEHTRVFLAGLTALYAFWTIFGAGQQIVFYGAILLFASVPVYAVMRWKGEIKFNREIL